MRLASGFAISARYFRVKTVHALSVVADRPSFIVGTLGARLGNQTSYQSSAAKRLFGTPRGGLRTVPMRSPSSRACGVPSRTMRTAMRPRSLSHEDPEILPR